MASAALFVPSSIDNCDPYSLAADWTLRDNASSKAETIASQLRASDEMARAAMPTLWICLPQKLKKWVSEDSMLKNEGDLP